MEFYGILNLLILLWGICTRKSVTAQAQWGECIVGCNSESKSVSVALTYKLWNAHTVDYYVALQFLIPSASDVRQAGLTFRSLLRYTVPG